MRKIVKPRKSDDRLVCCEKRSAGHCLALQKLSVSTHLVRTPYHSQCGSSSGLLLPSVLVPPRPEPDAGCLRHDWFYYRRTKKWQSFFPEFVTFHPEYVLLKTGVFPGKSSSDSCIPLGHPDQSVLVVLRVTGGTSIKDCKLHNCPDWLGEKIDAICDGRVTSCDRH